MDKLMMISGMFFGLVGFILGLISFIELRAFQKSTHKIQFMPAEAAIDDRQLDNELYKEPKLKSGVEGEFDNLI